MRAIGHALSVAGSITWAILWALILGFALSAIVQGVARKATIARLLVLDLLVIHPFGDGDGRVARVLTNCPAHRARIHCRTAP